MRKVFLMCILCTTTLAGFCPESKTLFIINSYGVFKPLERLWRATCMVESSNNPNAWNKAENAVGIVQIRPIRLRDHNRRTGKSYTLNDCYSPKISKEIWLYYARRIGFRDYETISRQWNGRGKQTTVYWNKIKKHL